MFASRSIALHLLRGCLGFALLAAAFLARIPPLWSVGLTALALLSFKGCPACWTIGLVETLASRRSTAAERHLSRP